MNTEQTPFLEYLSAELDRISQMDDPREAFFNFAESDPVWLSRKHELDDYIFDSQEFMDLCTKHAKWIL